MMMAALSIALTACGTKYVKPIPPSAPCAELPAPPEDDSADSWIIWQSEVIRLYGECALRK